MWLNGVFMRLTYCLNVHPGESWAEQFDAIRAFALPVRNRVAAGKPFGLGLRLSARSARELAAPDALARFRDFLADENLYAFTINGFPYGAFHGARVKEQVYRPDWRTEERVRYTLQMAEILAALAPPNMFGSVSSVPVGYAADFSSDADRARAADHLIATARALAELETRTGVRIALGLEPEPGCVLETRDDTLRFFELLHARAGAASDGVQRHIGVCLDTCHVSLAFEDLAETWDAFDRAGIAVVKIQLSAALEVRGSPPPALSRFAEPVYLHQVRLRRGNGEAVGWPDLPDALAAWPVDAATARVHFHVPLHWSGGDGLGSTRDAINEAFWQRVRAGACPHVEIETYTFDVLPPELRAGGIVDSISAEFRWVQSAGLKGREI